MTSTACKSENRYLLLSSSRWTLRYQASVISNVCSPRTTLRSLILSVLVCICSASSVYAQSDPTAPSYAPDFDTPLIDQEPFDVVYLTPAAGGAALKVLPFAFPDRKVPAKPADAVKLKLVLAMRADREYEVKWGDIERIDLYEQMILADARKLFAEKRYGEAFARLNFLFERFPKMPGLEEMRRQFLLQSARDLFVQGRLTHAMATLEEIRRVAPDFETVTVMTGISRAGDLLITQYMKAGQLNTARDLLNRLATDYRNPPLEAVTKWRGEFEALASKSVAKALELKEAGNLREARTEAIRALSVWPELDRGRELAEELNKAYPLVRIGVFQAADPNNLDASNLSDWAARRAGYLTQRSLFEFRETGPEGGEYAFALGTFEASPDRQELELRYDNRASEFSGLDAFQLGQQLLHRADPSGSNYNPSWSAILREVAPRSPINMVIRLKHPHVLPQAMLQWSLNDLLQNPSATPGLGLYAIRKSASAVAAPVAQDASTPKPELAFIYHAPSAREDSQPIEIDEVHYTDASEAVNDLLSDKIDVIDQLFPADARMLANASGIRIDTYALPSVHMLVPLSDHAYLAKADFRRALMYATNREAILNGELLGGVQTEGCQIISGPFPIGTTTNDPLAYAYDASIEPYPYDPRVGQLLVTLTSKQFADAAEKKKEKPPELLPLKLACPDTEFSVVACEAIIQQWASIGVKGELVRLPAGQSMPMPGQCDLAYISAVMWEPVTDAARLLGAGGTAESDNAFIVQALRQVRTAKNWREVRDTLQQLHRLVSFHLPVMPLWQITDRFAYRDNLKGVAQRPINLYQDIQKWRIYP